MLFVFDTVRIHAYAVNFPPSNGVFARLSPMSIKAARGTKRVCQNCGSKFYDLNRDPIICPICQSVFQQQDGRAKAAPVGNAADADEDDEALSPAMANVDMVSLDEVADAENELPDIDDDETFIEDEDDSGDDVSGLLGGSRDEEDEI
jgi:uncharacterized protein (TIGR02300 family)